MKKRRKSEHGAITVFLSGVLVIIIAFMGMLVDLARMRVADAQAKRAAQLALDSVMTGYSRRLREDYGLFGYAGGDAAASGEAINATFNEYMIANLEPDAQEQDDGFLQLIYAITGKTKVSYGDMLNMSTNGAGTAGSGDYPLSNPDVLYQQILEFSKFRVPIDMALSGTLKDVEQMQESLTGVQNDAEAYDRIGDLGEPTQEYYEKQDELSQAMSTLNDAVAALNYYVNQWNAFVSGTSNYAIILNEGKRVAVMKYKPNQPYYSSQYASGYFIDGYKTASGSSTIDCNVSAVAYALNPTFNEFKDLRNYIWDKYEDLALGEFKDELNYQNRQINGILSQIEARMEIAEETEDDAYETELWNQQQEYMRLQNQGTSDYNEAVDAFNNANHDASVDSIVHDIIALFQQKLQQETQILLDLIDQASDAVDAAKDQVETAIENLESQGEVLSDEKKAIEADLKNRKQSGKMSETVYTDWESGEKKETETIISEDEKLLPQIKSGLETLDSAMEVFGQLTDALDAGEIASGFINDGVVRMLNGNNSIWNAQSKLLPNVGFNGSYPSNSEKSKKAYEDAKGERDRLKNEGDGALDVLEAAEKNFPPRYNTTPIPADYKKWFISVEETKDTGTSTDVSKKEPENVKADEVDSASSGQISGLGGITSALSGGLQYILGIVYCSEYIMNMFANAAPAQHSNRYDPKTFEYEVVINLRNEFIAGSDRYDELLTSEKMDGLDGRLSYFYNAEVEYILFGNDKEEENANRAQILLRVILVAANFLQVRNHDGIKAAANALAAAGASIGIPPSITRFVTYLAFSAIETELDMFFLMRGYKIPAFNMEGGKLFMFNVADVNSILDPELPAGDFMINYEFYLRLRLMMALSMESSRNALLKRMANLIQLNINYAASEGSPVSAYASDAAFRMSGAYTTFKAKVSARMPYWFMTMAMMGENRQDESGYAIPEFEIVSSY